MSTIFYNVSSVLFYTEGLPESDVKMSCSMVGWEARATMRRTAVKVPQSDLETYEYVTSGAWRKDSTLFSLGFDDFALNSGSELYGEMQIEAESS